MAGALEQSLFITMFVFSMMILVDYINILTEGGAKRLIKGGMLRQYVSASLLGVSPGCLGAFMGVSLYVHGLLTFGAIAAVMVATSGDEAFVMLALFPGKALILFAVCFVLALATGPLFDAFARKIKLIPCPGCELMDRHEEACEGISLKQIYQSIKRPGLNRTLLIILLFIFFYAAAVGKVAGDEPAWMRITFMVLLGVSAFIILTMNDICLEDQIWNHIVKRHLWRIFLWTFGALFLISLGTRYIDLRGFISAHLPWALLAAALVAIIPQSGPHLIFVMLYKEGMIPFSVLLTSAIVQDGHGLLPLLPYSLRDVALIKLLKIPVGLAVGGACYLLGF